MFRQFLFPGIGVLTLLVAFGTPGRAHAQHGRGAFHGSIRSFPAGSVMPGMRLGFQPGFGHRFDHDGFRRRFDRDRFGRRFDRDRFGRRFDRDDFRGTPFTPVGSSLFTPGFGGGIFTPGFNSSIFTTTTNSSTMFTSRVTTGFFPF